MAPSRKKHVPNLVTRDSEFVRMSNENDRLRVELQELKKLVQHVMAANVPEETVETECRLETNESRSEENDDGVMQKSCSVTIEGAERHLNGNDDTAMQIGESETIDECCGGASRETIEDDKEEEDGGGDFTEVIKKQNRKRKKSNENGSTKNQEVNINVCRVSEITINNNINQVNESGKSMKFSKKIPPINAFHQNGNDLVRLIKECGKVDNFELKKINTNKTQIRVQNTNDYHAVKEVLKKAEAPFFSFTPKEEKEQTFLLKGLSEGMNTDELLIELKEAVPSVKILTVRSFATRRSQIENRVLPIYLIKITSDSSAMELLRVKNLNHQVVRLERLRHREAMQCYRCQRYGHSSGNCNMQYRCVKCNDEHEPGNCGLQNGEGKEKVFCVNCKQFGHPASFKGCMYYELWKPKMIQRRQVQNVLPSTSNINERPAATPVQPGVSFAAVARQKSTEQHNNDVGAILKVILDRLERIEHTLDDHGSKIARLMARETID